MGEVIPVDFGKKSGRRYVPSEEALAAVIQLTTTECREYDEYDAVVMSKEGPGPLYVLVSCTLKMTGCVDLTPIVKAVPWLDHIGQSGEEIYVDLLFPAGNAECDDTLWEYFKNNYLWVLLPGDYGDALDEVVFESFYDWNSGNGWYEECGCQLAKLHHELTGQWVPSL